MPWGRFALGLSLVFVVQATLIRFLAAPFLDLFLLYALLLSFVLPVYDARIAAFLAGLAQDMGSDAALGTHAFALGVAAIIVTKLRGVFSTGPFWVRLLIGASAAIPALLAVSIHAAWRRGGAVPSWPREIALIVLISLIASAIAAYMSPTTGLRPRTAGPRW